MLWKWKQEQHCHESFITINPLFILYQGTTIEVSNITLVKLSRNEAQLHSSYNYIHIIYFIHNTSYTRFCFNLFTPRVEFWFSSSLILLATWNLYFVRHTLVRNISFIPYVNHYCIHDHNCLPWKSWSWVCWNECGINVNCEFNIKINIPLTVHPRWVIG